MGKPDALRLAEMLEQDPRSKAHHDEAAAELRRLSVVEAQRDALLEVLQDLCDTLGECGMTDKARAAIKAVEGEKK